MTASSSKVKRNSIAVIRASMLEEGALLFKFDQPAGGSKKNEHVTWFEQMEELGFLATTTGCLLPYANYSGGSKGRPKGHKVSALFFKGPPPQFPCHPHGWPVSAQVSHLCHRRSCVNPNHLTYEPQWMNLKRNYCGNTGSCDCGMHPKCVSTYHKDGWEHADALVTYDVERIKDVLHTHLSGLRYTVLPKNHFNSVDKKSESRNQRLRMKRRHPAAASDVVHKRAK